MENGNGNGKLIVRASRDTRALNSAFSTLREKYLAKGRAEQEYDNARDVIKEHVQCGTIPALPYVHVIGTWARVPQVAMSSKSILNMAKLRLFIDDHLGEGSFEAEFKMNGHLYLAIHWLDPKRLEI